MSKDNLMLIAVLIVLMVLQTGVLFTLFKATAPVKVVAQPIPTFVEQTPTTSPSPSAKVTPVFRPRVATASAVSK